MLALIIALAAYTSSVGQKLREASKLPIQRYLSDNAVTYKDPSTNKDHTDNLHALTVVDVILIFAGLLIVSRIIWFLHIPQSEGRLVLDKVIIEVLGVTILYFAYLHAYQWWKACFQSGD